MAHEVVAARAAAIENPRCARHALAYAHGEEVVAIDVDAHLALAHILGAPHAAPDDVGVLADVGPKRAVLDADVGPVLVLVAETVKALGVALIEVPCITILLSRIVRRRGVGSACRGGRRHGARDLQRSDVAVGKGIEVDVERAAQAGRGDAGSLPHQPGIKKARGYLQVALEEPAALGHGCSRQAEAPEVASEVGPQLEPGIGAGCVGCRRLDERPVRELGRRPALGLASSPGRGGCDPGIANRDHGLADLVGSEGPGVQEHLVDEGLDVVRRGVRIAAKVKRRARGVDLEGELRLLNGQGAVDVETHRPVRPGQSLPHRGDVAPLARMPIIDGGGQLGRLPTFGWEDEEPQRPAAGDYGPPVAPPGIGLVGWAVDREQRPPCCVSAVPHLLHPGREGAALHGECAAEIVPAVCDDTQRLAQNAVRSGQVTGRAQPHALRRQNRLTRPVHRSIEHQVRLRANRRRERE